MGLALQGAFGLRGCRAVVVHGFSGFGGFRVPALGTSGGEFPRCFADKSEFFGLRVLGALGFRHPKIPLTGVKERAYGLPDCRLSRGLRVEILQCVELTEHQSSNRLTGSPEEHTHTHTHFVQESQKCSSLHTNAVIGPFVPCKRHLPLLLRRP